MQSISIQIQPEAFANFNRELFLQHAARVNRTPEIDQFEEQGKTYLQFHFFTEMPKKLWNDLRSALYDHPDYASIIKPISIAVFDDENQPLIYLHHFDSNEKIGHL